ncbi:MAG: hypothetical protein ACR2RF_11480 [Geminicoccaceae bacterium]
MIGITLGLMLGWVTPCGAIEWHPIPPAAQYCDTVENLEAKLSSRHGERLIVMGTERSKGQYRLYYSERSGSWTMAWVDMDGRACVRLIGRHRVALFGVGT